MSDYDLETIEDVNVYIGKENTSNQKADEKIGGIRITEPKYKHLIKKNQKDFTYLINKKEWKN